MNLKGSLPVLILHILEKGPDHGYHIAKEIKQQSQGVLDFKEGTLYPTLHGLQQQGYITAYNQEENGRIRRYYQLTDMGHRTLVSEVEEWNRYSQAINLILKGTASS